MVHVHGLHRAEAVEPLQLIRRERVDCLQERVVSELQSRVQRDRSVQCFAPHVELGNSGNVLRETTHYNECLMLMSDIPCTKAFKL